MIQNCLSWPCKFFFNLRTIYRVFFLFVYTFKLPLIPQFSLIFKTLWRCYSQKHVHLEKLQMVQWNKILISKKDKEYNTIFQESQNSVIFLLWRFLQRIDQGTVLLRNIPKERSFQGCNHAIGTRNTDLLHQVCASVKNQIQNALKSTVDI